MNARTMEYMTEDEAKMKWCPAVRQLATSNTGYICAVNTAGHGYGLKDDFSAHCIGSNCMWWREMQPGRGRCGMVR